MKTNLFIDLFYVLMISFLIHYVIYQNNEISRISNLQQLCDERNKINEDQLRDITYQVLNNTQQNSLETIKNQSVTQGILMAIKDPEETLELDELWHDGYYRGMDQNMYAEETIYENGYNAGMDDAMQTLDLLHKNEAAEKQDVSADRLLTEDNKDRDQLRKSLIP